jgi:hypothetical protein
MTRIAARREDSPVERRPRHRRVGGPRAIALLAAAGAWGVATAAIAQPSPGVASPPAEEAFTPIVLDDFEDISGWAAFPADGVALTLASDAGRTGRALRMDFAFTGGGYAVARKAFDLELPENYAFTFQLRAEAPVNHLEMKFLDASGENVWWYVRRDMTFPGEWTALSTKKRQITFAWGPQPGELRRVAAIEIVVTAGTGGSGSVWIDDLELRPLPPPGAAPPAPVVRTSSAESGSEGLRAVDGDTATAWQARLQDPDPWLRVDYGQPREFGGLTIDWRLGRHASNYRLDISDDGAAWRPLAEVTDGNGGRDYLFLPESEGRYVRVRLPAGGRGLPRPELVELALQPLEFGATREAFFKAIAREAPRGAYPRAFLDEPSYWTVVGPDDSPHELLVNTDGLIETGKQKPSIEPFLRIEGRVVTWADAVITNDRVNDLPIPRITWEAGGVRLTVTPFDVPSATPGGPGAVRVRYLVSNTGDAARRVALHLAVRPFQANPPAQFLNFNGGTARLRHASYEAGELRLDDRRVLAPGASFTATTFAQGDIVADFLLPGLLPPTTVVDDAFEAASGLLSFPEFLLVPGASREFDIRIPLGEAGEVGTASSESAEPVPPGDDQSAAEARWKALLGPDRVTLPASAAPLLESLRAQVGYILINRAGPAIQPGTRAYARSWIRDGSLTSSALLRLGYDEPVRQFLEWFAPHQYANGKIPCVVDWRGADPVPEHDSSGQFIFLVAEYLRYTGDRALAERMWPRVARAAAYLDSLRHERRTDEYRHPDRIEFFGILPPSISHEGYSAKPMHSYWDDSFAYKGFTDAAWLANELGHADEAARWTAVAREFGADYAASVAAAQKRHGIDYIPGCADLGDFDATSTTTAFSPTGAALILPRAGLEATFQRYAAFFDDRKAGAPWEAFTPYEVRNIGAFVQLGWRDRAHALADWFLETQKPVGWRQWPEIVWSDESTQKFLGDLPHTWVGSDFIRSVLDMLVYVHEDGRSLVIGAGVPSAWIDEEPGVAVLGLPTPWGPIRYRMTRSTEDPRAVVVAIEALRELPPGGIVVRAPGGDEVVVRELPARLTIVTR